MVVVCFDGFWYHFWSCLVPLSNFCFNMTECILVFSVFFYLYVSFFSFRVPWFFWLICNYVHVCRPWKCCQLFSIWCYLWDACNNLGLHLVFFCFRLENESVRNIHEFSDGAVHTDHNCFYISLMRTLVAVIVSLFGAIFGMLLLCSKNLAVFTIRLLLFF